MLLKLKRTQKTAIGMLRAGVAYTFDEDDPAHMAVADRLLERGLAKKTTKKALSDEATEIAARQAAELADAQDSKSIPSAIMQADIDAQKAAEDILTAKA